MVVHSLTIGSCPGVWRWVSLPDDRMLSRRFEGGGISLPNDQVLSRGYLDGNLLPDDPVLPRGCEVVHSLAIGCCPGGVHSLTIGCCAGAGVR